MTKKSPLFFSLLLMYLFTPFLLRSMIFKNQSTDCYFLFFLCGWNFTKQF